jgi:hypothetical protein
MENLRILSLRDEDTHTSDQKSHLETTEEKSSVGSRTHAPE